MSDFENRPQPFTAQNTHDASMRETATLRIERTGIYAPEPSRGGCNPWHEVDATLERLRQQGRIA